MSCPAQPIVDRGAETFIGQFLGYDQIETLPVQFAQVAKKIRGGFGQLLLACSSARADGKLFEDPDFPSKQPATFAGRTGECSRIIDQDERRSRCVVRWELTRGFGMQSRPNNSDLAELRELLLASRARAAILRSARF